MDPDLDPAPYPDPPPDPTPCFSDFKDAKKYSFFHIYFLEFSQRHIIFSPKNEIFAKNFVYKFYFAGSTHLWVKGRIWSRIRIRTSVGWIRIRTSDGWIRIREAQNMRMRIRIWIPNTVEMERAGAGECDDINHPPMTVRYVTVFFYV